MSSSEDNVPDGLFDNGGGFPPLRKAFRLATQALLDHTEAESWEEFYTHELRFQETGTLLRETLITAMSKVTVEIAEAYQEEANEVRFFSSGLYKATRERRYAKGLPIFPSKF